MSIDDSCTYAGRYVDKQAKQVYMYSTYKKAFFMLSETGNISNN